MKRGNRADRILKVLMLMVSLALMLGWLYKAFAVKDLLFMKFLGPEEISGEKLLYHDHDARMWLAGKLTGILRMSSPLERLETEETPDGWIQRLMRNSPLVRYLCDEKEPAAESGDPDPSYAGYLDRHSLLEESWYILMYGDENSYEGMTGGAGSLAEGRAGQSGINGRDGLSSGRETPKAGDRSAGNLSGEASEAGNGSAGDSPGKGPAAGEDAAGDLPGDDSGRAEMLTEAADSLWAQSQAASLTPAYHRRDGLPVTGTAYVLEQLQDYDYLMNHFFSVHPSTTAGREVMDAEKLLTKDLSIEKDPDQPQILIYHTHSQETYADYGPDHPDATVVSVGTRLTELLEEKGYRVIHDTTAYDIMNGELDRNHAYNFALDGITAILQRNPSIQVVLDIHRDGVSENLRLVTEIDGKLSARIMFFNGMSQTPDGPIEYLPNPYRQDNLAFSLQMQIDAAAYYPGFTRNVYLKGLRYNLHVRPRSALIEVGAQTNTYEEAANAMEPLAELLDMVLSGT